MNKSTVTIAVSRIIDSPLDAVATGDEGEHQTHSDKPQQEEARKPKCQLHRFPHNLANPGTAFVNARSMPRRGSTRNRCSRRAFRKSPHWRAAHRELQSARAHCKLHDWEAPAHH